MVYGKTPFSDIINVFQKLTVISSPEHRIEFPATILSPLQLKQPAPAAPADSSGGIGAMGEPLKIGSMENGGVTGALPSGTAATGEKNDTHGPSAPTKVQITIAVDPQLIRIMKGCLAREPKDRLTIPEMLQDGFLHPYPVYPAN
jgi:hypothetical protein